ncbi:hypothetical protein BDK51DRAFT_38614 [Blyttiomyces helicus]|uniref:Uncharacterized protein n=1 Tax=Blyttiomyces helicus TaxID=388810 RepID=A0A4P9WLL0_9FUNG|nr:hypothetical protein BDK51DRAFT_38614 [Blyttiomyces helicus]|eukprot:RKO93302.1 hypothetical protein BDK51DRAFT_38614 [Blyttiomyces helicus]
MDPSLHTSPGRHHVHRKIVSEVDVDEFDDDDFTTDDPSSHGILGNMKEWFLGSEDTLTYITFQKRPVVHVHHYVVHQQYPTDGESSGLPKLSEKAQGVGDTVEDATDAAARKAREAQDRASDAIEKAKQASNDAAADLKDKWQQVTSRAEGVIGGIKEKATEVYDNVKHMGGIKEKGTEAYDIVKQGIVTPVIEAADDFGSRAEQVTESFKEGAARVTSQAQDLGDAAKKKARKAKRTARGALGGMADSVGRAAQCLGLSGRTADAHIGIAAGPDGGAYNPVPITSLYTTIAMMIFVWLFLWAKVYVGDATTEICKDLYGSSAVNGHADSAGDPVPRPESPEPVSAGPIRSRSDRVRSERAANAKHLNNYTLTAHKRVDTAARARAAPCVLIESMRRLVEPEERLRISVEERTRTLNEGCAGDEEG